MEQLDSVLMALREVLSKPKYAATAMVSFFVILFFFITAAAADERLMASVFGYVAKGDIGEMLLLLLMLAITSIIIAMDLYLYDSGQENLKEAGVGIAAIVANTGAVLLALLACPLCTACVFWAAVAVLLIDFRPVAITAGLVLLLMALLYTSERVIGKCEACRAVLRERKSRK